MPLPIRVGGLGGIEIGRQFLWTSLLWLSLSTLWPSLTWFVVAIFCGRHCFWPSLR